MLGTIFIYAVLFFCRWALRFGPTVLGAISAVSGLLINRHYRWKLRLGSYGYFASTIPIAVMPGLLTTAFHKQVSVINNYDFFMFHSIAHFCNKCHAH